MAYTLIRRCSGCGREIKQEVQLGEHWPTGKLCGPDCTSLPADDREGFEAMGELLKHSNESVSRRPASLSAPPSDGTGRKRGW